MEKYVGSRHSSSKASVMEEFKRTLFRESLVILKEKRRNKCRFCFQTFPPFDVKVNLVREIHGGLPLYQIANTYLGMEISASDEESTISCLNCAAHLVSIKEFREKSRETQKKFQVLNNAIDVKLLAVEMGDSCADRSPHIVLDPVVSCPNCGRVFQTPTELIHHAQEHLRERFRPLNQQQQHKNLYRPKQCLRCSKCPVKFELAADLAKHEAEDHKTPEEITADISPPHLVNQMETSTGGGGKRNRGRPAKRTVDERDTVTPEVITADRSRGRPAKRTVDERDTATPEVITADRSRGRTAKRTVDERDTVTPEVITADPSPPVLTNGEAGKATPGPKKPTKYTCHYCKFSAPTCSKLSVHELAHHSEKLSRLTLHHCSEEGCFAFFRSEIGLTNHMKTHE